AAYPVFHGGLEPMGHYAKSNRPANTVMVINVGASAGTVGFSTTEFWSSDGCYAIEHCDLLNSKFLYYALIGFQHHLRSRVRVAGIPTLDAIVVEKIKIPVPSPAEQARIVAILDKFDTLTNSISEGLPKEIELREKQYAYYRDLLFNFPKPEGVA
ncbi:restriction endonuclease subunit S, partial [bacterium]|nr:restriction endonuclease subunit S [bacterium]